MYSIEEVISVVQIAKDSLTYDKSQTEASQLNRSQLSDIDWTEGMAQSKAKAANQFTSKELGHRGSEVLSQYTSNTDNAGKNDDLLTAEEVRHITSAEGGHEYADCRGGIEQLLVGSCNHPSGSDSSAESLQKGINAEKMAHVTDLIAKVDWKHVNQQAYVYNLISTCTACGSTDARLDNAYRNRAPACYPKSLPMISSSLHVVVLEIHPAQRHFDPGQSL